jgi:hypothetical protein
VENEGRHDWPALPLQGWEPTYLTLHRWTQIVGKIRLAHSPWVNHWWHAPLYVDSHGLTATMPCDERQLTLSFDFGSHRLTAHTSDNRRESFDLEPMSVATFHDRVFDALARLGVRTSIWPVPVEVVDTTPFPQDRHHAAYDRAQVESLHRILLSSSRVFSTHRGRFLGKCSPVHFFWGAFDLAVTRFSGKRNPNPPPDPVQGEAYSHEVISHGFWPGGDWPGGSRTEEPVFYAYTSPQPAGFAAARVRPAQAKYSETLGEFLLPYEAVRTAEDPDARLLEFIGARLAGWDVRDLQHPRAATLLEA